MDIKLEDLFYVVPPQNDPQIQEKFAARSDIRYLRKKYVSELQRGAYYPHQKVVHKLITLYDRLLLIHETGTGKSCSAIGIAEYFKKYYEQNGKGDYASEYLYGRRSNIRHVYVLVHGDTLAREFRRQIVCVCSAPNAYTGTTENKITRQLNDFYTIIGYSAFYNNYLRGKDENYFRETFDNTLIIVDEVHNIIPKEEIVDISGEKIRTNQSANLSNVYYALHRLFHVIEGSKVLLLSATPITNEVWEVASVMNLLLPNEKYSGGPDPPQMPVPLDISIQDKEFFRQYFTGYVSYAPKIKEDILVVNEGERRLASASINGEKYSYQYNIMISKMRGEQLQQYRQLISMDEQRQDNFYINQQKISTFAIPPRPQTSWQDSELLARLADYSCKMDTIIRYMAKAPNNVFIFSHFRQDIIEQIEQVFRLHGYRRFEDKRQIISRSEGYCTGSSIEISDKLLKENRYAILTPEQQSTNAFQKILELFNHPENRYGQYIKVLIGSPVSREGINLNNVTQIHILTPEWNEGKIHQSLSRAIRINSFENLPLPVTVQIFKHVAVDEEMRDYADEVSSEDPDYIRAQITYSVDEYIYNFAAHKQLYIDRVMGFMREFAIDRYVNNPVYGDELLPIDRNIYLTDAIDRNYSKQIIDLFRINGEYTPQSIANKLQIDIYATYQILDDIMNKEIPVRDKYGFRGKLLRNSNVYYIEHNLDKNMAAVGSSYYANFLALTQQPTPFPFFEEQIISNEKKYGDNLQEASMENPIWVVAYAERVIFHHIYGGNMANRYESLLKNEWLNQYLQIILDNSTGQEIEYRHDFSKFFPRATKHGESSRLTKPGPFQRIFIPAEFLGWRFLRSSEEQIVQKQFAEKYENIVRLASQVTNSLLNSKISGRLVGDELSIIDNTNIETWAGDKRKISTGRKCMSFSPAELLNHIAKLAFNLDTLGRDVYDRQYVTLRAIFDTGITVSDNQYKGARQKLLRGDNWRNVTEISDFKKNIEIRIGSNKKDLCDILYNFFSENGILTRLPDL